jgi:adenylate cyclase
MSIRSSSIGELVDKMIKIKLEANLTLNQKANHGLDCFVALQSCVNRYIGRKEKTKRVESVFRKKGEEEHRPSL